VHKTESNETRCQTPTGTGDYDDDVEREKVYSPQHNNTAMESVSNGDDEKQKQKRLESKVVRINSAVYLLP